MDYGYIDPDYLEDVLIEARPGLYEELSLTIRPMGELDRSKFNAEVERIIKFSGTPEKVNPDEAAEDALVRYTGEVLVAHVRSWNLRGRKGPSGDPDFVVDPSDPAVYGRLRSELLHAILDELTGAAAVVREEEARKNSQGA